VGFASGSVRGWEVSRGGWYACWEDGGEGVGLD
jgi:hypothetical protein